MRRNLVLSLAIVLVLGLGAAVPAGAKAPLRGDQIMVLNQDPVTGAFGLYGCPELSWFGTIELDGETYGMALYPMPGRFTGGGNILHYEEAWKVWTGEFGVTYDPVTESFSIDDCTPGDYVLSGTDFGVGNLKTGKFVSNSTVDEAYAPFEE